MGDNYSEDDSDTSWHIFEVMNCSFKVRTLYGPTIRRKIKIYLTLLGFMACTIVLGRLLVYNACSDYRLGCVQCAIESQFIRQRFQMCRLGPDIEVLFNQIHMPTIGWSAGLLAMISLVLVGLWWLHRKNSRKAKKKLSAQRSLTWEAAVIYEYEYLPSVESHMNMHTTIAFYYIYRASTARPAARSHVKLNAPAGRCLAVEVEMRPLLKWWLTPTTGVPKMSSSTPKSAIPRYSTVSCVLM